ncbi:MAG: hypothetical protein LBM98_02050 [Oscillospiraceae bacterium]|nr:hypothetical protein [Oscillospiraceae bacterium]
MLRNDGLLNGYLVNTRPTSKTRDPRPNPPKPPSLEGGAPAGAGGAVPTSKPSSLIFDI